MAQPLPTDRKTTTVHGVLLQRIKYHLRVYGKYGLVTRRYRNILKAINKHRCRRFLEVGVFRGDRAVEMIETALQWYSPHEIAYFGFDLFEDLSSQDLEREFSKVPSTCLEVQQKLEQTQANVELFQGYSSETLPRFVEECHRSGQEIDLIFIDGGHSTETIASDWCSLEPLIRPETVVLLDDYYPETRAELRDLGCKTLIDDLDPRRYRVEITEPEDRFEKPWGALAVRMVYVRRVSVDE